VEALGIAAAILASTLFNVGLALQALEARTAPKSLSLRVSLLGLLLRRPRWVLGWALGVVGIAPQILALDWAPFVVVQPALAIGLLLLLVLGSRLLGEAVGAAEVIGVVLIIGGVALVAAGAPGRVEANRGAWASIAVVAALAVPSLVPFAVRGSRFDSALLAVVASGCGFAATNIATKLMSDDVNAGEWNEAAVWAAVGIALGIAATVTGMTAFQRRAATMVVPATTAVQTFLPIVAEPLFLRERWASAPLYGAPLVVGVAAALAGTILLSRTPAVSDLVAGARK
jgi:hypothetical protein